MMRSLPNRNSNLTASASTRKYATQVGNLNRFNQKIQKTGKKWSELINSATSKEQLDKSITEIWDKLKEISKRCFPPFQPKTKFTQWWSPNLNALREQVNALKRRVKRCKNSDLKEIANTCFKALKNRYKAELLSQNTIQEEILHGVQYKYTLEDVQNMQSRLRKETGTYNVNSLERVGNHFSRRDC
jgi:membrane-associated HD superfamily phosphohydrolase